MTEDMSDALAYTKAGKKKDKVWHVKFVKVVHAEDPEQAVGKAILEPLIEGGALFHVTEVVHGKYVGLEYVVNGDVSDAQIVWGAEIVATTKHKE